MRSAKMRFYVVTETADNKYRAAALKGKPVSQVTDDALTYFPDSDEPAGDLKSAVAMYNWRQLDDDTNASADLDGRGTKGWNAAGKLIAITEEGVASGKARAFETLRHEVQHDADKFKGLELSAGVDKADRAKTKSEVKYARLEAKAQAAAAVVATSNTRSNRREQKKADDALNAFAATDDYALRDQAVASQKALQRYKTEYRAHFYQGNPVFDALPHRAKSKITREGFQWTDRQWAIFEKIRRNYGYVADAWGPAAPNGVQTSFRAAVAGYWNPDKEGFNKYDSVRIDDLYNALHWMPVGTTDANHAGMPALLKALNALDSNDLDYLEDKRQAVMLRAKIRKQLKGAARAAFQNELDDISLGRSLAKFLA